MEIKARSHADDYRMGIRAAIRGFWSGALDRDQFTDNMMGEIDRGLRLAFQEGAAASGVKPEDYTEAEQDALQEIIENELGYIAGLADDVETNSKKNKGKLQPLFDRSELWIRRYHDIVNRARVLIGKDGKFKWVLGRTEQHCDTCARLNGQVRRGSFWAAHVLPQSPPNGNLECGGWRCDCELEPTDEPVSHGSLPGVP